MRFEKKQAQDTVDVMRAYATGVARINNAIAHRQLHLVPSRSGSTRVFLGIRFGPSQPGQLFVNAHQSHLRNTCSSAAMATSTDMRWEFMHIPLRALAAQSVEQCKS